MSQSKRQLHFNLFIQGAGHHPAAWQHPSATPTRLFQLDYYSEIAQLAEVARLDAVYINDRLANRHNQPHFVVGHLETFTLLAALAVRTQQIGLIASASSIYNQPYHVARKLSSLDYASRGRAGWSIRPSRGDDEAHNYGLDGAPRASLRAERTREFVDVVKKLWDSWEDDAVTYDPVNGLKSYPEKVRPINHHGAHFDVAGPLNVPRPIQGHVVLAQDYAGADSEDYGALENAEVIFTSPQTLPDAISVYLDVKSSVQELGRNPEDVRVFSALGFILGETPDDALENQSELESLLAPGHRLARLSELLHIDLSSYPLDAPLPPVTAAAQTYREGSPLRQVTALAGRGDVTIRDLIAQLAAAHRYFHFVGTPLQLADHIESWFEAGAVDGFNLRPDLLPLGLEQFANQVVPELQRRGLFRTEYESETLRGHYGLTRPENCLASSGSVSARAVA